MDVGWQQRNVESGNLGLILSNVLSGTEGFSLISFTYFCSPLSPLIVISQVFHFVRSLIIDLYAMDCGQTPFLPVLFPLSLLSNLSAAGN